MRRMGRSFLKRAAPAAAASSPPPPAPARLESLLCWALQRRLFWKPCVGTLPPTWSGGMWPSALLALLAALTSTPGTAFWASLALLQHSPRVLSPCSPPHSQNAHKSRPREHLNLHHPPPIYPSQAPAPLQGSPPCSWLGPACGLAWLWCSHREPLSPPTTTEAPA